LTAHSVPEELAAQILDCRDRPSGPSQSDIHRWLRFAHLIDNNAILKLHCATSPILTPVVEKSLANVSVVRLPVPYPPHPGHPRRTGWIAADDLVGGDPPALQDFVSGDVLAPLDLLADYVIRPIVAVFRELVEDPGPELFVLDVGAIGFEVTAARRLTGRLVVADATGVPRRSMAARPAAQDLVRRLAEYLVAVAQCFDLAASASATRSAHERVDDVLAEELRFLRPETAAMLGRNHPWARFVHVVDPGQDRNLRAVLRAVAECARQCRADPSLPPPVVQVDPALADGRGLRRFAWDVRDAGGRLVVGPSDGEADPGACGGVSASAVAWFVPAGAAIAVRSVAASGASEVPCSAPSAVSIVSTFETLPRSSPQPGVRPVPSLSHTRSLEELQLAQLRTHRLAREYVVRMSTRESVDLIGRLVAMAETTAQRAATGAVNAFRHDPAAPGDHRRTTRLVRHLLTRKQFIKGSRSYYTDDQAVADMLPFVRDGEPIRLRMMGFPLKQGESGLKALGGLPDLAEVGALVRLRELHRAVQHVYPPGIDLTVLTDASHFRPRSTSVTRPYEQKLTEYARLADCDEFLRFVDVDTCAESELAVSPIDHARCVRHHRLLLESEFDGMDITHDPLSVLRAVAEIELGNQDGPGPAQLRSVFRDLFMSIVFSVPVPLLDGADRLASSKAIYDDLYNLDRDVPHEIAAARKRVLVASWDATIRYVSTLRANRDLDYDALFDGCVRLKASAPRPGTCGFSFLGGSCLLPWQGTGAVSVRGEVSTDFVVALLDQGFVPVFSPLLGDDQPWMMVPVTATQVLSGGSAAQVDRQFAARIRLRRR